METITQKIINHLWFDTQAEEAAIFYTSIFKNSKIGRISYYGKEGQEIHKMPVGLISTIEFILDGQEFVALNGGPVFKFNEAISLMVNCKDQKEVDYFWDKLKEGGAEDAQQCGWLKDKYGISWQIVPTLLREMVGNPDSENSERAMAALMKMKKIDIEELRTAYNGEVK